MATKIQVDNEVEELEGFEEKPKRRKGAATLETGRFSSGQMKKITVAVFLYYLLTAALLAMLLGTYGFLYLGDLQPSGNPKARSSSRATEASPESAIETASPQETSSRKDEVSSSTSKSAQKGRSSASAHGESGARVGDWERVKTEILGEYSGVLYTLASETSSVSVFAGNEEQALCIDGKLVILIKAGVWEKIEGHQKVELLRRVYRLALHQNARTTPQSDLKYIVLRFDDGRKDLVLSVADQS